MIIGQESNRDAVPEGDLDHIVEKTAPFWDEMRNGRIFVSGGTGFFGKWMVQSFLHANDRLGLCAEMVLLARDTEKARHSNPCLAARPAVSLWRGEMERFAFPPGAFTHVLHMATHRFETPNHDEAIRKFRADVTGTERVLEFAARSGARKFLYTSSGAVYGPQPRELSHIFEEHPHRIDLMDPGAAYAMGKRAGEFLCAQWGSANGFEAKIARCFAFAGPHLPMDKNFAIGNFLRDVLAGDPVTVQGDGTPCRSYLYAADLAVWLWTILFRGKHGCPYNTGSETTTSILELARLVARVGGSPGEVRVSGTPVSGTSPPRYVPSTRRAREEMGLTVHVELEDAIRRTIAWHRGGAH